MQNHNLIVCRTLQNAISAMKKYRPCKKPTACATQFMQTVGADLYVRPKVPFRVTPTACATQFMQTVGADLYIRPNALRLTKQSIHSPSLRLPTVGADLYVHPNAPFRVTPTACATQFMQTVGADLYIRPKVPFRVTPTACATQFMQTVGADLYIRPNALRLTKQSIHSPSLRLPTVGADLYVRPKVPFRVTPTACATQFMQTVGADLYIRPNALRLTKQSIHSPSLRLPTVGADLYVRPKVPFRVTPTACATKLRKLPMTRCPCTISIAMRHRIMVIINEISKWIVCTRTTRLGGHISPPLPATVLFQQSHMR